LGQIGGKEAIKGLKLYLQSPISYLRSLTISALSEIGNRQAITLMLEGFNDSDPFVQSNTDKAFRKIYNDEEMEEIYKCLEKREVRKTKRRQAWEWLLGKEDQEYDEEVEDDYFKEEIEEEMIEEEKPKKSKEFSFQPNPSEQIPLLQKLRQKAEKKLDHWIDQIKKIKGNSPFGPFSKGPNPPTW